MLDDQYQSNFNKLYCSCHLTWPPGSLSFESLGNGCLLIGTTDALSTHDPTSFMCDDIDQETSYTDRTSDHL